MLTRSSRTRARPVAAALATAAAGALLLSSCARFDDSAAEQTYQPAPELTPQAGPQPELPEAGGGGPRPGGPGPSAEPVPPPQGCTDFDPAVVQTCLDTVSTVAALPGDGSTPGALAGERRSGRVLQVAPDTDPVELATLPVDASGDGGLTGLALSPSYGEDQLVFAYLTTPEDNRVVRFAQGQEPKPVLTGIPRGATGNGGALASDGKGALLVATGNAGDPAAAADPASLAGKVLRIDPAGQPAEGNPTAGSAVYASGLHAPGGLCASQDGSRLWVTDRAPDKDAIFRVQPGAPLTAPAWTWPDRPGVAGCSDWSDLVMVATSTAGNMQNLPVAQDGSITGRPTVSADGENGPTYGKLAGMDMVTPELGVAGTINKDGGQPVSSDDRVVLFVRQQGGPGNGKD
ncbi:glucose dehydrogenase [Amycolatopsis antarctica]|uniref:Glucose dehydrogenase n=1 Tax=Amycolatopsis antarctica TaxID=1854586 RepID=A0A263D6K6_9PSEU|nr:PQQ-dependent sugar dehydrogenase [Amycolatopsis antarctica]OZM74043.1 glucose dehydrogenase [Amycolatopsis antarctica]